MRLDECFAPKGKSILVHWPATSKHCMHLRIMRKEKSTRFWISAILTLVYLFNSSKSMDSSFLLLCQYSRFFCSQGLTHKQTTKDNYTKPTTDSTFQPIQTAVIICMKTIYIIWKKRSSDLCGNGMLYFVMLFLIIKYFNSISKNQVEYLYLYLYCLAQLRFLLAGTIQHIPTNIKCWHYDTQAFCSRLSIFKEHQQLCGSSLQRCPS